jgi:hypothetical protein
MTAATFTRVEARYLKAGDVAKLAGRYRTIDTIGRVTEPSTRCGFLVIVTRDGRGTIIPAGSPVRTRPKGPR